MGKYKDEFLIFIAMCIPAYVGIILDQNLWCFCGGIILSTILFIGYYFFTYSDFCYCYKIAWRIKHESKVSVNTNNKNGWEYTKSKIYKKYVILLCFGLAFAKRKGTINRFEKIERKTARFPKKYKSIYTEFAEQIIEDVINHPEKIISLKHNCVQESEKYSESKIIKDIIKIIKMN